MPTIYVTVPPSAAESMARELVAEGYAACVNRISCTSTYRWEGSVEYDDEEILLVKTTDDAYDALVEAILERHPYDVPAIERFDETDANHGFTEWLEASVSP